MPSYKFIEFSNPVSIPIITSLPPPSLEYSKKSTFANNSMVWSKSHSLGYGGSFGTVRNSRIVARKT